jgi:hypothetical protein
MAGGSWTSAGSSSSEQLNIDRVEEELRKRCVPRRHGGSNSKTYWRRLKSSEDAVADLQARVSRLESLLTPEQVAQLDLIRKAEHVIDVAIAEGQLEIPPI